MNDTGTVCHGNVVSAGEEVSLCSDLCNVFTGASEERFIFAVFETLTCHFFENFISGSIFRFQLAENGVEKCFRHVVGVTVSGFDLAVDLVGVNGQTNVGGKRPGGGRPSEEVSVFADCLEADDRGAFLYGFITLRNLVGSERSTTTGAVRNDLEAFVKESLVVDLLESPPFGFDLSYTNGTENIPPISRLT